MSDDMPIWYGHELCQNPITGEPRACDDNDPESDDGVCIAGLNGTWQAAEVIARTRGWYLVWGAPGHVGVYTADDTLLGADNETYDGLVALRRAFDTVEAVQAT